MATRLTAAKLKELQFHRHQEEMRETENARLRNEFIEGQNKKEAARLAKLQRAWNEQKRGVLQCAIGGDSSFNCSCLIWPDRLIDAGFKLFKHDVKKLSKAIAESERASENICAQIFEAHLQAIALLEKALLARFKNMAVINAAFDAAHCIRVQNDDGLRFREALIEADPLFNLIDTRPAAGILDRLDALYVEYESDIFTTETLEMQVFSEEEGYEYDDAYPDDVTPALTPIESGSDAEKLLPSRGARLRVSWENNSRTETENFDFAATTLKWISTSGQPLFNHIDNVVSEFPSDVTNYAFEVTKNIHGQFLICGGVNKFYESPPPAYLLICMQALGFQCVMTPTEGGEEATISIRW